VFNFNHLYYFYMTAHFGGVSKASKALKMSQPSLSSQVKVLESVLDRRLFRKVGRNMRLTGEGERVFEYCRRMFSTAEELERSLRDSGRAGVAQLRIGVTEQIERPFVADILSHLLREPGQPHPGLKIVSGEKDSLLDQLRAQQIDLALTNSPAYGTEFMEVASFDMPVGLVISRQLYRDQEKRLREIPRLKSWMIESKLGLVLPSEKMKLRHETDQYLQKHAVRPPVTLESDVLSLVVRAVVDGAGMGFLPLAYLGEELRQGSVVPIFTGRTFWSHQFRMIVRKRETLDPQIKAMIASANAVKGSFTSPQ
jgi:LysR family transcriptional activator of nhaA